MPRGWKGTVVSIPHSAQMASYRSRWYPPSPRWALRAERQLAHRLGSFVNPFDAKNSCSPTVKTKGVPQSTQVMVLSASSTGQFLNFLAAKPVSVRPFDAATTLYTFLPVPQPQKIHLSTTSHHAQSSPVVAACEPPALLLPLPSSSSLFLGED